MKKENDNLHNQKHTDDQKMHQLKTKHSSILEENKQFKEKIESMEDIGKDDFENQRVQRE